MSAGLGTPGYTPPTLPKFSAYKAGNQTISTSTFTKITFETEEFDIGGCFAGSTFTPNVAGKYLLTATIFFASTTALENLYTIIYKNGAEFKRLSLLLGQALGQMASCDSCIVDANGTTDAFEVWTYRTGGTVIGETYTRFQGALFP